MYDMCWSCTTRDLKIIEHLEATFIIWLDQKSIGERFTYVVLFYVSTCVKEVKMQGCGSVSPQTKLTTLTQQCQSTIIPHFNLPSPQKFKPLFSGLVTSTWKSGWICGTSHPFIGICESEDFGVAFYTQHRDTRREGDGETEDDVEGWWWNTNPTTPSPDRNGVIRYITPINRVK